MNRPLCQALGRLSPSEQYDRAWRIRRAVQYSILHQDLPRDQWIPAEEVCMNSFYPHTQHIRVGLTFYVWLPLGYSLYCPSC